MPDATLLATAIGTDNAWATVVGGTKVQAVQADDGDTSYNATTSASTVNQTFQMQSLPGGAMGVTKVDVVVRARCTSGTPIIATRVRYSGNTTNGGNVAQSTSYATLDQNFAQAPGALPWTPAIVNATEAGYAGAPNPNELRVTMLSMVVSYQIPGGFWFSFLLPWFGPLAAVGLHEIPKLAAAVAQLSRGRARILPSEYRAVFEGLRVPRRRYVLLSA